MAKKIVIIDDEAVVRDSLKSALSRHPCEILIAEDGAQGIKLMEQIDERALFLVDLLMPHLDGWGLLDRIREHGTRIGVEHRIILVSGSASAELIATQEEVGFISKPFNLADIKAKIVPFLSEP